MIKIYFKHFVKICKHKYFVGEILMREGLYWQAITHDLSKFSFAEFISSARYFSGTKSPIEAEKSVNGYSEAWLHHKGRNKHHWQYWIDFTNGKMELCRIPENYLKEMAADVIGASKAYLGGNYDPNEPINYFKSHQHEWSMKESDKKMVEFFIKKFSKNFK